MMVKKQGPYSERYDGMQLKIERKRLKSGKCQVKFYTKGANAENLYGYALMDGEKSLTDIVKEVRAKLLHVRSINGFYHQHLFSINRKSAPVEDFVIFRA